MAVGILLLGAEGVGAAGDQSVSAEVQGAVVGAGEVVGVDAVLGVPGVEEAVGVGVIGESGLEVVLAVGIRIGAVEGVGPAGGKTGT